MSPACFVFLTVLAAVTAATPFKGPSSISDQNWEPDPNDPEYKELAKEAYYKYLETQSTASAEALYPKEIIVTRVTIQIVEGTNKIIDFMVHTIFGRTRVCHSEIWERVWLNKKEINVNCV